MKGLGIIQARMGSERFNGKSLLTIGDEKVISDRLDWWSRRKSET